MNTVLATPIEHLTTVKVQRIDNILLDMKAKVIDVYIGDYEEEDSEDPYNVTVMTHTFDVVPAGVWKQNMNILVKNMAMLALAKGFMHPGANTGTTGLEDS